MKKIMTVLVASLTFFAALPLVHGQGMFEDIPYVKNPDDGAVQKTVQGKPRPPEIIEREKQAMVAAAEAMIAYVAEHGLELTGSEVAKKADGTFGQFIDDVSGILTLQILEPTKMRDGGNVEALTVVSSSITEYIGSEWVDLYEFPDLAGFLYIPAMNEAVNSYDTQEIFIEVVWADPAWADNQACRHLTYRKDFTYQGTSYMVWNIIWLDE